MAGQFSRFYKFCVRVARIPVGALTRRHWEGQENLPKDGGFVAVVNHISEFDSMTMMHFMTSAGYPVRILCKEELFRVPVLGSIMRSCGQIPVYRESRQSRDALAAAIAGLQAGECITVYGEGTLTRDPDFWPMRMKTGAARMALRAQVPLVPVVQWGAQDVLDRYGKRPNLKGKKDVWVKALPPVDLSDLYERADDPESWYQATARIETAICRGLEQIRETKMPHRPLDRKSVRLPSKKQLAAAAKAWRTDNPGKLPTQRKPGELDPYLKLDSAAEPSTSKQEG